jgi:hypothetical protein
VIWIVLGSIPMLMLIAVLILDDPGAFAFAAVVVVVVSAAVGSFVYGLQQIGVMQ